MNIELTDIPDDPKAQAIKDGMKLDVPHLGGFRDPGGKPYKDR